MSRGVCSWSILAALPALFPTLAGAVCSAPPTRIDETVALVDRLRTGDRATEAFECLQAALAAGLGSDAERAHLQLRSAQWLEQLGRYREARTRLRRLSTPSAKTAAATELQVRAELAWVEYRLGDSQKAERVLSDVVASQAFPSDLEHAIAFDRLGVVERERNRYAQAEQSFVRALALLERNSATEAKRTRAQVYNDRGGLRTFQGDFRGALEDFHRALELYRDLGMLRTVDAAKALNNIGNAHRELGDAAQARSALLQALDLKTELVGPDNPSTASTITNLGMVAEASHDYLGAQAYYARALAIYENTLGANHANVASVAAQYGRLRFTTAQYGDALQLLERARAIREHEFGLYSNWSAETLVDLVPVYAQLGQRRRAREGAERALTIAVIGDEQELLYDSYMSYARTLAAHGQASAGIFFGKRALNVIQQMRERDVPPTKREQRFFILQREFMYRDVADWLLSRSRLAEAEEVLDLLKAEELADYAQLPAHPGEALAARVGLVQREVQAAATLDTAIRDLSQQTEAAGTEGGRLGAARAQFRKKLQEVVATLADAAMSAARSPHDLAALGPAANDSAMVRYLVVDNRVRILVRTRETLFERSVRVDRKELSRQVLELHHRLQSHLDAAAAAHTLFQELIAPISAALFDADIHELVLMPDDVLRYVPFAALQDGRGYLIESFALTVATPAARTREAPTTKVSRRAAALGVSRTPDGQVLLPNVPVEVHRVVRQSPTDRYGVLPGIILLDQAFTRDAARQVLSSGYPVVHVASHFVFRPTSLADSYLLLGDGTHLTLERIGQNTWPLRDVEILTLSACDTAVGDADADGREIESFAAVVQRQGVRSVLATLWAVPDLSTSVLMAKFYATLAQRRDSDGAPAGAIRAAQLLLLRGPDRGSLAPHQATAHSPYADPFYWAGFVLLRSPT